MTIHRDRSRNPHHICTWQPGSECADCQGATYLMCRFDARDLVFFLAGFLPFGITAVAGMIQGGFGWFLLGGLAYSVFFFFVWEARVLCSHCPYWALEDRVLRCHANYGVIKIWRYRPGPMSRAEQFQFIVGALLFVVYPLVFMLAGRQYLLILIALASVGSAGLSLWRNGCSRCVNFSCPANNVPKEVVDSYLRQNPVMREAWEASGYRLGE